MGIVGKIFILNKNTVRRRIQKRKTVHPGRTMNVCGESHI